jgi:DNA-binding response OmpR family regulator
MMPQSSVDQIPSLSSPDRERLRRGQRRGSGITHPCTLEARIDVSAAGSARILKALHAGCGTFVLSAVDGQMSARVRLTIVGARAAETECRLGAASATIDWSRSTVANGSHRVALSRTELRLLAALLEGDGQPVPRSTLIGRVWPSDDRTDVDRENTLGVYIWSLRKRLASIGAGNALQTVRGVGYRVAL